MEEGTPGVWVRQAAAGEQAAWNALVDRYNAMVWSIARSFRLSAEDASDVVQTTWLHLVEHLDRVKEPDRIGSWLATTARNECFVQLRRRGRQGIPIDSVPEVVDVRLGPGDALLVGERDSALWAALQRISERCRQLLRILASEPAPSYQEVGAVLDMPVGSIGPTRARCLGKLREALSADPRPDDVSDRRVTPTSE